MPLIPEDKIAEVRDRTDIVAVIGEYVALRRSGPNYKGLCPFHNEKTPSFNVNSQKQIFNCFGCGKGGDVFRFIMEHDGKQFIDVMRDLAKRAGVDLPEPERTPQQREAQKRSESDRSRLLRVLQLACDFFRAELASPRGERGRAYIDKRGISEATRDAFLLGYAPPGWDGLVRFLEAKRVPAELAERAGLVRARDNAQVAAGAPPTRASHFDLFRDRVLFPLLSPAGEVIAFGGRTLDADPSVPKYINSPETALYKKGENLYGLHAAKAAIRKAGRAILVEGNFDVLMMHERGLTETVAPMGTALTREQVQLLRRYAPGRVYIFLDGDGAGLGAAARAVGSFLDEDVLSFVALLPQGDDPDTFARAHGKEGVELIFKRARESVEYFCSYVWKRAGSSIVERVKVLEEEAAPLIRKVRNETARRSYGERLALELDLPLDTIGKVLRGGRAEAPPTRPAPAPATAAAAEAGAPASEPTQPPPKLAVTDVELIRLVADHPRLLHRLTAMGALRSIRHPELRRAFAALIERTDSTKFDASAVAEQVGGGLRQQVMEAALSGHHAGDADPERALAAIVRKVEEEETLGERKRVLAAQRASVDPDEIRKLTMQVNELNQRRLGLKG